MSALIIVCASALFICWLRRLWLLSFGSNQELVRVLESDYWFGRRVWSAVQAVIRTNVELLQT